MYRPVDGFVAIAPSFTVHLGLSNWQLTQNSAENARDAQFRARWATNLDLAHAKNRQPMVVWGLPSTTPPMIVTFARPFGIAPPSAVKATPAPVCFNVAP